MTLKETLILLATVIALVSACGVYLDRPLEMDPNYSCSAGDTPLGFHCITMTYPELTTDINRYPCFVVNDVSGRYIEVLIEPVNPIAQVRTCIREDGFSEQCARGVNNYCRRVQSTSNTTIIRVYCLTGGCETTSLSLWFRAALSPSGLDEENWCLNRSQDTPSSLSQRPQPTDQTFNFDQDGECRIYVNQSRQMNPMYNCSAGDTPLGFQCVNITRYPCYTVEHAIGRFIEVLVEPANITADVSTCIRENGAVRQCSTGVNSYCGRVRSQSDSVNIRISCLTEDCNTTALWVRIDLSPNDTVVGDWCSTRPRLTPTSLINVQPSINPTDNNNDQSGFDILQPFPAAILLIITIVLKLMLN